MKFGAVPDAKLSAIDLRLPPEPPENKTVLPGRRAAEPKVYVGAGIWGNPAWAGKLYPPKAPATQYRNLYPQHFTTIELNATHYTIYPPEVLQQWALAAKGKDFKFCPKFPQQISHQSGFKDTDSLTAAFLESVRALEDNLGPVFLQVSESFSPVYKEALFQYLFSLPKDLRFFLEVRHPGWFSNKNEKEDLFTTLRQLGMGAIITDVPARRDVVHMQLTLPTLFLRFVCNGLHPTSFSRANDWVQKIQQWLELGLEEAYVTLHPGNDAAVPELAQYWVEQLNRVCGMNLKVPISQPGLF